MSINGQELQIRAIPPPGFKTHYSPGHCWTTEPTLVRIVEKPDPEAKNPIELSPAELAEIRRRKYLAVEPPAEETRRMAEAAKAAEAAPKDFAAMQAEFAKLQAQFAEMATEYARALEENRTLNQQLESATAPKGGKR